MPCVGAIDRDESEARLRRVMAPGRFLVRQKSNNGRVYAYSLLINAEPTKRTDGSPTRGKVSHAKLEFHTDGTATIDGKPSPVPITSLEYALCVLFVYSLSTTAHSAAYLVTRLFFSFCACAPVFPLLAPTLRYM